MNESWWVRYRKAVIGALLLFLSGFVAGALVWGSSPPACSGRVAVEIAVEGRVVRCLTVEEVNAALLQNVYAQQKGGAEPLRVDLSRDEVCGK